MNIKIDQVNEHYYRADCLDLPGTPPCGTGNSPEMAVACLFYLILFDSTLGPNPSNWIKYLDKDEPIWINDEVWKYPVGMRRKDD